MENSWQFGDLILWRIGGSDIHSNQAILVNTFGEASSKCIEQVPSTILDANSKVNDFWTQQSSGFGIWGGT
jgi:hypothetical protein